MTILGTITVTPEMIAVTLEGIVVTLVLSVDLVG